MSSFKLKKNKRVLKLNGDQSYSESIKELDLNLFPLVDDFQIVISDEGKDLGLHIKYYSKNLRAIIASFPWWDHVDKDLQNMSINEIPIGNIDQPFDDLEQSWQIVIWENSNFVYIIEGEEPCCLEFRSWFKVEKDKYIAEWDRILKLFTS